MPKGLLKKYRITKANGRACDPKAEYFVLRLDRNAGTAVDSAHVEACRAAVLTYAKEIAPVLPELAADIQKKYPPHDGLYGRAY